ncbi:short-chain dehydrogenase/reductase family 9C member 7-like [Dermacentor andersoni]|uniref:short-chain dehydrogenase/reductase family 9C member 7-like n=1 Tax=Dermacentor andersoni TaxID=34620 RepID=UPI0021559637|nr:retinol dehydrogenase 5-like [Dermacentor andersoni]
MRGYAGMLITMFLALFSALYMVPLVRTIAHLISLTIVVVVVSHYLAVWLLKMFTYKVVPSKGKVVVITRCDSGYGNRLALQLDRRGFTVVAGCVSTGSPGTQQLMLQGSSNIHVVDTDVTQPESLAEFEKHVRALCKGDNHLWAVIINLSVVSLGELEWYDDDDMRWTYEVNVLSVARVARIFLPLLRESPHCGQRFVIVNSVWSRIAVPGTGPYCMSKYAVRCFTEVLRRELIKFGIYVVGIEPNLYRLPQTEPSSLLKSYKYMWEKLPDETKDLYSRSYGDEMEANIRNIIVNEPDPVVREVAKKMLDSVQTAHPNRLYQPDLLTRKILYAGFRMLPDEITDFWLTEISGLMKA